MKYGIFLDDERVVADVTWLTYPKDIEWVVVRTSQQFFEELNKCEYDYISFDHDIQDFCDNGEETTGYDVLKGLAHIYVCNNVKLPVCFFHTQNPIGKKNMESYYQSAVKFMENNK